MVAAAAAVTAPDLAHPARPPLIPALDKPNSPPRGGTRAPTPTCPSSRGTSPPPRPRPPPLRPPRRCLPRPPPAARCPRSAPERPLRCSSTPRQRGGLPRCGASPCDSRGVLLQDVVRAVGLVADLPATRRAWPHAGGPEECLLRTGGRERAAAMAGLLFAPSSTPASFFSGAASLHLPDAVPAPFPPAPLVPTDPTSRPLWPRPPSPRRTLSSLLLLRCRSSRSATPRSVASTGPHPRAEEMTAAVDRSSKGSPVRGGSALQGEMRAACSLPRTNLQGPSSATISPGACTLPTCPGRATPYGRTVSSPFQTPAAPSPFQRPGPGHLTGAVLTVPVQLPAAATAASGSGSASASAAPAPAAEADAVHNRYESTAPSGRNCTLNRRNHCSRTSQQKLQKKKKTLRRIQWQF
ncbi:hypothetical protein BS78_04G314400 [Paspalum vaginatum]|nr:hypothetical protein BS78_04G314400 [Paspalum vaginatum]